MQGTLYLVATPIGNLQDITFRAVETLRAVDLIACEDTRHTQKLLNHFRISNKVISYHEHNENERAESFLDQLNAGRSIAIVSDAGTPGIADPSFRAVTLAIDAGVRVVPIPGPAAFVNAVVASGLPTDSIFFGGFLPSKGGDRRKRLEEIKNIPATLVLYETPHRIVRSLSDCLAILGDRRATVAREITKMHETFSFGTLSHLAAEFSGTKVRGEIVVVIDRASEGAPLASEMVSITDRVGQLENEGLDNKAALKKAAKEFGLSKSEAYRQLMVKGEK
ncbi:MAG: 16S rRNA (cytidine(1402)-2'-O)-methyltransferase [Pyrinomonadaceae bacterium]|nr:16S rRNA (cytidine(1402)-2'-O)-methyltransferase [Pyrinomonadaceae bacterium]